MIEAGDLLHLPKTEKLRMMELLWADLTSKDDDVPSPVWHARVLEETTERVEAGLEAPVDWDEAKAALRSGRK